MSQTFEKVVRKTGRILMGMSACLLAFLMLIGTADVVGRYFFNRPILGTAEISCVLLALIVFFSWAYVSASGAQITAEFLLSRLSARSRVTASLVVTVLSLVFFILLGWQSIRMAIGFWRGGRIIDVLDWPLAPFLLALSFSALVVSLELIVQMVNLLSAKNELR